jgi:glycosyltransferase involved in cell wall biosynthesis
VRKLAQRGLDVYVVAPDARGSEETATELPEGFSLITVPAGSRLTLLRGMQPWRRRAAAVVRRLGADIVHGQGVLPGGIAAREVSGLAPIVVTARGNARQDTLAEYRGIGGWARAYVREQLARAAVEAADVVVGVNPDWAVNIPVRPRRFVYIPNMIDERFFESRVQSEFGRVLFAGGTRAIKGWALLAHAWPLVLDALPEARLNVVNWPSGEVPPGLSVRDRASLDVEGPLSSDQLADRMVRAAALVIPSLFEVSPIVLAEGWALGLPVVATPVGGVPALATGAALLVERRPEALAESIVTALRGGDEVARLVEEGRRRAEAHRPEAVVSAHLTLYEDLCGVQTAGLLA